MAAASSDSAAPLRSIVLRAPDGEVGWSLIELQGAMVARDSAAPLDDVEFGTLVQEEGQPPKLVMGKMQLEGEVVKLKKPLAIMSLQKDDGATEYHAAGVVRQKFVFKTRPVPVVIKATDSSSSVCGTKRARIEGQENGPTQQAATEPPAVPVASTATA